MSAPSPSYGHIPVLRTEVLEILKPEPGEAVLDCTLGLGGHSESFLQATAPDGTLTGLDADTKNLQIARTRLTPFGARVTLKNMNFRDVATLPPQSFDCILADLGLSSPHIDDATRGFSFRAAGPLDLRYDQARGKTAAEMLMSSSEQKIVEMLRNFGEVDRARQLGKELHTFFRTTEKRSADCTTDDVKLCVEKVFTFRAPAVLPQVFQALRIAVNDELGALQSLLEAIPKLLRINGRVGIISYHSLEDRLVKQAFKTLSTPPKDERTGQDSEPPSWALLTAKPVTASAEEQAENPRARSAKFRALRRLR